MLLVILGGYFLLIVVIKHEVGRSFCLFKTLTGIPCPGCGMGRATTAFIHGKLIEATIYHPFAIPFNIFLILSCFWILYDLFTNKQSFYRFMTSDSTKVIKIIIVLIVIVLWVYNIWREI